MVALDLAESSATVRAPAVGSPAVRELGLTDYETTWRAMKQFTASREAGTRDEFWLTEHPPVFTQGLAGKPEHLLRDIGIPVVRTDRGGQITYHGPGQAVLYALLDLGRRRLKIRELVHLLEQSVVDLVAEHGIAAERRAGAPGVYVRGAKIASLGLRVRGGCCYHGLALNVEIDLAPFSAINPCGYEGLTVTRTRDLGIAAGTSECGRRLAGHLTRLLRQEGG